MIYYFVFTISFFLLFFYRSGNSQTEAFHLSEVWGYSKENDESAKPDIRSKIIPLKELSGYRTKNGYYIFYRQEEFTSAEGELLEPIPLGKGIYTYKKVGKFISFYSESGELLWQKEFKSYPRSDLKGDLVFLVAGDGNQVLVTDGDGNETGIKQLDGRFLTDLTFPQTKGGALVVFSGGEIFMLDKKGNLVFSKEEPSGSGFKFYKSGAISPNGNYTILHLQKDKSDSILLLDSLGSQIFSTALPSFYPHRIYMAVSDSGVTLLNLPDAIYLVDIKGTLIFKRLKKKSDGIYNLAFHSGKYFVASSGENLFFLNEKGEIIKTRFLSNQPARMLPSSDPNFSFLETTKEFVGFDVVTK